MPAPDPERDPHLAADLHIEATYRLTEALVEVETRMRRRVQLLSEIVFETDAAGQLIFLNDAWTATLGHAEASCMGRSLAEFVADDDWPRCARALAGGAAAQAEARPLLRLRRHDGGVCWMELSVAQIPGGGTVGALHDVTQRKRAQDEVAKLSLVASYTDNMVIITDRDGRTEWVNEAFTKRTGYTLSDLLGRRPGALLQGPGTDRDAVVAIGEGVREGRSFRAELLNYTKQGEPYWVQVQITPIRNAQGDVERFVSIQTDITELHRTQRALEEARERAEAANDAKTQFLATISHEMRTPLGAILGSIDLALAGGADAAALRTHLTRAVESAELLQRFISDVLDVAKIEAGQIDVERVPVAIRPCLQRAIEPLADRARAKGLDFRLMVDASLPAELLGDPDRLRQIVTKLVENAIKFTDRGSVRVEVSRLVAASAPDALELRVVDSGVGISTDAQTRIFDRFVQGDSSTTRRKGGAGLGLSIVKSLAEAFGGGVTVQSREGEGADFRVHLPLVPVPAPTRTSAKDARRADHEPPTPGGIRILVADDNDLSFSVAASFLRSAGHAVVRAADGREALARARDCDLILMDVEMPEMDGIEATRGIRAVEAAEGLRPVPILVLTAHALQAYRDRCLAAGCTGYLTKPIRLPALLQAVTAAIAS